MGHMRSIVEIATVERAVAEKIYPAGTTLIRTEWDDFMKEAEALWGA